MNLGRDYNPEKFQFDVENHISSAPIMSLVIALSECPFLQVIHMSDNGLRGDQELFLEVLDYFGLGELDI